MKQSRLLHLAGRVVPARFRRDGDQALAGRRVLFAMCGALAGSTAGDPATAVVSSVMLGALGWRGAALARDRSIRMRAESIRDALPDALDLLTLCVLAGMGLDPALRMVAAQTHGPLGDALRCAVAALDVGLPRDAAYRSLVSAAATPEVDAFVAALLRAERYGSPPADTLAAQAADARDRHRSAMRERALAAPVRMLFPLTLCFLPAFVLLAIAPSLIVAVRSFRL